jgi:hypothetical protein
LPSPEDEDITFHRNVGNYLSVDTASHPKDFNLQGRDPSAPSHMTLNETTHATLGAFSRLTTQLTSWSKSILDNMTVAQLVNEFLPYHGSRRFITMLLEAINGPYPGPVQSS